MMDSAADDLMTASIGRSPRSDPDPPGPHQADLDGLPLDHATKPASTEAQLRQAPSPVHYELTFHLSHVCCRVRTDQLPFERDVRRSSRRTSTDAIQAVQMALVMAIDSLIGGELGRASSPAYHSGQAVGGLTRQLGEPGAVVVPRVDAWHEESANMVHWSGVMPCDRRSHQHMQ